MAIVSVSLPESVLKEVDALQKKTAFTGRSEFLRATINEYVNSHYRAIVDPDKYYTAILSVVVAESQRKGLHEAQHEAEGLVRAQFHLCIDTDRCMETMGLHGTGKAILSFLDAVEALPKVEKITLAFENCSGHRH